MRCDTSDPADAHATVVRGRSETGGRTAARRPSGCAPDRDGLWAGCQCARFPVGCAHFRDQRPAGEQSNYCPHRRPRNGKKVCVGLAGRRRQTRKSFLAWTIDLSPAAFARNPPIVTADGPTVGVRWPSHPFIQAVLRECGFPLAAPSANLSNRLSPTNAEHVRKSLGHKIKLIVDGGQSQIGIESTVLDLSVVPPRLLRPGMIHEPALLSVTGELDLGAAH